ncbi:MAG: biotin transporter BioY [Oscillospiraceae bacterium]|jgi:biotin transport system substrate-specific component|nr:biotin transporter BioY [Oscillospiraceae bacterium]
MKKFGVYSITRSAVMAAVLIICGFVKFQMPGLMVMTTLQVFAVLLIGLLLSPREAVAAVSIYVLIGLIGIPIFTRGGGIGTLATYEGGYIVGFIVCAFTESAALALLAKAKLHFLLKRSVAVLVGIIALYAIALPYITVIVRMNGVTLSGSIISIFCLSYLQLDLIKAAAAVAVSQGLSNALTKAGLLK